jgi:hypothetical protein
MKQEYIDYFRKLGFKSINEITKYFKNSKSESPLYDLDREYTEIINREWTEFIGNKKLSWIKKIYYLIYSKKFSIYKKYKLIEGRL